MKLDDQLLHSAIGHYVSIHVIYKIQILLLGGLEATEILKDVSQAGLLSCNVFHSQKA